MTAARRQLTRALVHIGWTTAAIGLWACGNSAAPTLTVAPSTIATPTLPAPAAITALHITGPATIAPGATGQFIATGDHADGSSEDVTARALWSVIFSELPVPGPNPLRVIGAGTIQALVQPSEAGVQARVGGLYANFDVLILQPGTFRVSGLVNEVGAGPIDGASVAIVSGTGAGQQVTSHNSGHYAFYGVAGAMGLRASADGYGSQLYSIVATDGTTTDLGLTPRTVPTDVSGAWTLTVSASPSCRARLPAMAQTRQYDAVITQQATQLVVTVSSPTLEVLSLPIGGRGQVFGQTLSFEIEGDTGYGSWSYPKLGDSLSPTESLGIGGLVTGTVTGSDIRATMAGDVEYWARPTPVDVPDAICRATDHGIVLRRK